MYSTLLPYIYTYYTLTLPDAVYVTRSGASFFFDWQVLVETEKESCAMCNKISNNRGSCGVFEQLSIERVRSHMMKGSHIKLCQDQTVLFGV